MAWGYVAVGAGTLIGGYLSSQGAQSAAQTQAQAGQAAIGTQRQMAASQQALQQPYISAGTQALQQIVEGTAPGGQFAKPFSMAESPAQQFVTKEALAAMQNQMQIGGQALSSNAISGAGKLAGDIASQYEGQAFNQWLATQQQQLAPLEFIASQGQAAASGQAANIGGAASNISGLQTGIGNVQAAGQIGAANAYSGAANTVSQYMMLQSLLSKQ